jgi:uncharacterized membrane protein
MNRESGTLLSLGVSMALIAAAIWFLYSHLGSFGYGEGRWRHMPHHIMFGGTTMGFITNLFWAVAIAAVVFVVSGVVSEKRSATAEEDPPSFDALEILTNGEEDPPSIDAVEILNRRYANGNIDKSQYETIKKDIT